MANLIINNLLNKNKEFNFIFNYNYSKGKIKYFSDISDVLEFNTCFKNKKLNLNYLFAEDLNLFSPYVSAINLIRAMMDNVVLDEYIGEKPKLVFGKQYLTKGFSNIYDSISLWIETERYIIDPVLSIIVDKSIKDKLFYKDLFVDTKYRFEDNPMNTLFNMDYVVYLTRFISKFDMENNRFPHSIDALNKNEYYRVNKSGRIREYLKTEKPYFYKKVFELIQDGTITDLNENMEEYDKIVVSDRYNPDLTLGKVLRKGLNYGRCGLIAKAFSETVYKDIPHRYCVGHNQNIAGSKNSFDGNHAWLETKESIVDTSLMLEIPKKFAVNLGYKIESYENHIPGKTSNSFLSEDFELQSSMYLYDVLFENRKNNTKIFQFDFVEFLPEIINNDYECKYHYSKDSLSFRDVLDESEWENISSVSAKDL